ncbi:MAG TPA: GspH/FimT family pseudopilin [Gemmatimonadales bacterium]|jgi:Tfp pilus assembly protein FimT
MRQGFALLELLCVCCVMAVTTAIAVPRCIHLADAAAVRQASGRLVAALDAARGAAVRLQQTATLTIADSAFTVSAVVGNDTVRAWRAAGGDGVTVTGAGAGISFSPSGMASGVANRTLVLTRGGVTRRVVVSRLGRLTY